MLDLGMLIEDGFGHDGRAEVGRTDKKSQGRKGNRILIGVWRGMSGAI